MITTSLFALQKLLDATLIGTNKKIGTISIDSRRQQSADTLFIALRGKQFDGHHFASDAIAAGASALLVEQALPISIPQLIVPNTLKAIGMIAAWNRQHCSAYIIAVTGSAGKTTVKEMVAAILATTGTVLATPGNWNNDIGVPLTLLQLEAHHQFAVIEMGSNQRGDIAYATNLTQPNSALITNIAPAHLAGLGSLAGVAREKAAIFDQLPANGRAIIPVKPAVALDDYISLPASQVWRFSTENKSLSADFFATNITSAVDEEKKLTLSFTLHTPLGITPITLKVFGLHQVDNAIAAAALAMAAGADLSAVKAGLDQFKSVQGRLYPIAVQPGKWLIDDTYNANVCSMHAAIDALVTMPGYRVLVVSDMKELGVQSVTYHQQLGEYIKSSPINLILSIGEESKLFSSACERGHHYSNKAPLIMKLKKLLQQHSMISILVKGSRSTHMESVISALQPHKKV